MGGVIDSAAQILAQTQQRVDIAAQNIANLTTPGYKRRVAFSSILGNNAPQAEALKSVSTVSDFAQGALLQTGASQDLAIAGAGFFTVRTGDAQLYTRQGRFHRNADGHLVSIEGYALQSAGGSDLVLKDGEFHVGLDGVVTQANEEVGRIALVDAKNHQQLKPTSGGFVDTGDAQMSEVAMPLVHQGMVEASNASNSQEMTAVMEAMRRAEAGQRLVHVYDDLMGRAISAFGGSGQ